MKNAVSVRLFPLCGFLFARTDRPIRLFLLITCLMLVYLPGYSRPEARCDTLGNAVVVFRPRTVADNNMPMVVTVTRAGEASSREDCIRQLGGSPYDKQTVTRFNYDAVHAVRTAEAEDRIRNAILSVVPPREVVRDSSPGDGLDFIALRTDRMGFLLPDRNDVAAMDGGRL